MNEDYLADMLAKLKDYSEMAIDLAYSALIYGSEEIADQVLEMEKTVNKLHIDFELAILEETNAQNPKALLGAIRLSMAAEHLVDAAGLMASIVKRGVSAHPVIQKAMEGAEETIVQTEIGSPSVLANKSLGELGLEDDMGIRIIAVRRGETWTYVPQDAFMLKAGDVIIARGFVEGREKLLALANPEIDKKE
jgi:uncharacterized protein with PhoU and TrkA domain